MMVLSTHQTERSAGNLNHDLRGSAGPGPRKQSPGLISRSIVWSEPVTASGVRTRRTTAG
eukprot:792544-Rhodomonas_salina.3